MITHQKFVREVKRRARLSSLELAEQLTRSTLRALAERLPAERREGVATALPFPLSEDLRHAGARHRQFRVRELYARIARTNPGVDPAVIAESVAAAISVLRDALPVAHYDELVDLLPPDYYHLLEGIPPASSATSHTAA